MLLGLSSSSLVENLLLLLEARNDFTLECDGEKGPVMERRNESDDLVFANCRVSVAAIWFTKLWKGETKDEERREKEIELSNSDDEIVLLFIPLSEIRY